ncbi:MAG: tRNA1(Val) (adenine(37)-N6)-methyltransferase [Bacteriovoracia bacterium]
MENQTPNGARFKEWAVPGPAAPGSDGPPFEEPGVTLDAISGQFRLLQLREGHRFSTDDLLVAWYGTTHAPCVRTILDLGSGIGSVATIAAWRLQGAQVTTIEAQPESVALARRSATYNGLESRMDIRQGDLRDLNLPAGFDLVLGSPPYFPPGSGIEGDHPQKVACRFEMRGDIADYCQAARRHLAHAGVFAVVFPAHPEEQRARADRAAAAARLRRLRSRDIIFKEGDPPLLRVALYGREEDFPRSVSEWCEPPLTIRLADGRVHPEYSVIKMEIGFPP